VAAIVVTHHRNRDSPSPSHLTAPWDLELFDLRFFDKELFSSINQSTHTAVVKIPEQIRWLQMQLEEPACILVQSTPRLFV
jgi:hypothetical protein